VSQTAVAEAAPAEANILATTEQRAPETGPSPFEGLPPELKAVAQTKGWKGVEDAVKAYANAEKVIGDKVAMPKTDAEREALLTKLGAPADGKYDLKVPEGVTVDADLKTGFETLAAKIKLLPAQAQALMDWNNELAKGQADAAAKAEETKAATKDAALEALKSELGADKFEADLTLATKAAEYGGFPNDLLNRLEDVMGTKSFVQCMARIGALGNEDQFVSGNGRPAPRSDQDRAARLYPTSPN